MPRINQLRQSGPLPISAARGRERSGTLQSLAFLQRGDSLVAEAPDLLELKLRAGSNAQEWEIPSASDTESSQFTSIDNPEGTGLASHLTGAPTDQRLPPRRKPWLTHHRR